MITTRDGSLLCDARTAGGASERVGVWTAFAFEEFDARNSNLLGALMLVPYGQSLCVLMRQQYLYTRRKMLFRS